MIARGGGSGLTASVSAAAVDGGERLQRAGSFYRPTAGAAHLHEALDAIEGSSGCAADDSGDSA